MLQADDLIPQIMIFDDATHFLLKINAFILLKITALYSRPAL